MEYAKLAVRVLDVRPAQGLDTFDRHHALVKLSFGHQKFKSGHGELPFQHPVVFSLSFHSLLFYFLQVDVYCADKDGCSKHAKHLGRVQLRVMRHDHSAVGWHDLRDKHSGLLPLDRLSACLNCPSDGQVLGSIQLELACSVAPAVPCPTGHADDHVVPRPLTPVSMTSSSDALCIDEHVRTVDAVPATYKTGILNKIVGFWLKGDDNEDALTTLQCLLSGYNQGLKLGASAMLRALLILQKYYKQRPPLNLDLLTVEELTGRSGTLLLAQELFRFAMAALGWIGPAMTETSYLLWLGAVGTPMADYLGLAGEEDVLKSEGRSQGACKPSYFVAYSAKLDAVVVAVRCTMEAADFVTDLVCEYVQWGPEDGFGHSGILKSAQWLLDECLELVEHTLRARQAANLYITGHSLGGGVAVVLCMLLCDRLAQQPYNIRCCAFAPPPVLSPSIATAHSDRIDCFVFKEDCVPRLSFGSMLDLQAMLAYCARITHSSPSWVFRDGLPADLLRDLDACRAALAKSSAKLVHSGQLHYMCTLNQEARIFRVPGDYFGDIRLSSGMFQDHLPHNYARVIDELVNKQTV